MPRTTVAEAQADMLEYAEFLLVASELLADDDILEDLAQLIPEEEHEIYGLDSDKEVSELLELEGLLWLERASALSGTGSRGPYNQFPKSKDYFSTTLQNPDRQFRHAFRFVCYILFECSKTSLILFVGSDVTPSISL